MHIYELEEDMSMHIRFWYLSHSGAAKAQMSLHIGAVLQEHPCTHTQNGPRHDKTYLPGFANNTGADQPAHLCSLISALVIHLLESIISRLAHKRNFNFLASLCS